MKLQLAVVVAILHSNANPSVVASKDDFSPTDQEAELSLESSVDRSLYGISQPRDFTNYNASPNSGHPSSSGIGGPSGHKGGNSDFRSYQRSTAHAKIGAFGNNQGGVRTNQGHVGQSSSKQKFPTTGVASSNIGMGQTASNGHGQVVGVRIRSGQGSNSQGSHSFGNGFNTGNTAGASISSPSWLRFNVGSGQPNTGSIGAGSASGYSNGGNTAAASVSTSNPTWLRFNIGGGQVSGSSGGSVASGSVPGYSHSTNTAGASVSTGTPSWLRFNVGGGQNSGSGSEMIASGSVPGYSRGTNTAGASLSAPSWLRFNIGGGGQDFAGSSSGPIGAGSVSGYNQGGSTAGASVNPSWLRFNVGSGTVTTNNGGGRGFIGNALVSLGIRSYPSSSNTGNVSVQGNPTTTTTTRCNIRSSGCGSGSGMVSFSNAGHHHHGKEGTESRRKGGYRE